MVAVSGVSSPNTPILVPSGAVKILLVAESGPAVIQSIGGEDGELGLPWPAWSGFHSRNQTHGAQSRSVIASQVHQLDGSGALGGADGGIALDKVACVKEQNIGPAALIILLQGRHLGVSGDAAVYVVGVQNDGAAR